MRTTRAGFLSVLGATFLGSQTTQRSRQYGGQSSREVIAILDRVVALPVEVSADLLFAAVDSALTQKARLIKYLAQVIDSSSSAQRNMPVVLVPTRDRPRHEVFYEQLISNVGLTRSDIKVRALRRLAKLDDRLMRQLAAHGSELIPETDVSCNARLVEAPHDQYYRQLKTIGLSGIRVSTPQQLARLIGATVAEPSAIEQSVIGEWCGSLRSASVSDRVFTATEYSLKLGENLEKLLSALDSSFASQLASAWLSYVDRHLSQTHCSDVQSAKGEDFHLVLVAERCKRLASIYKLDLPAFKRSRPYSSAVPNTSGRPEYEQEIEHLLTLARQIRDAGGEAGKGAYATALKQFAAKGPMSGRGYAYGVRIAGMMTISRMINDDIISDLTTAEIFKTIEHSSLKSSDPLSWLCIAKGLLLMTEGDTQMALSVRARFESTTDPDLSLLRSLGNFIKLSSGDPKDPWANSPQLFTPY